MYLTPALKNKMKKAPVTTGVFAPVFEGSCSSHLPHRAGGQRVPVLFELQGIWLDFPTVQRVLVWFVAVSRE